MKILEGTIKNRKVKTQDLIYNLMVHLTVKFLGSKTFQTLLKLSLKKPTTQIHNLKVQHHRLNQTKKLNSKLNLFKINLIGLEINKSLTKAL